MRESCKSGSVRGACDETHVPTATPANGSKGAQNEPARAGTRWARNVVSGEAALTN
jgi:hypothetical protein